VECITTERRRRRKKVSPDFSVLSEDTQDALFLINLSVAPNVPFTDIAKGKIPQKEAWIKYHWAGSEDEAASKSKMWDMRMIKNKAKQAKTFIESLF
jgi:hypothetical protein